MASADAVTIGAGRAAAQLSEVSAGFPLGVAEVVGLGLVLCISLAAAALATAFSMSLARRLRVLAIADERSSHEMPTPRLGGIGYFIPLTLFMAAVLIKPVYLYGPAGGGFAPSLRVFIHLALICGSLAFVVGLMDDFFRLRPWFKLLGQIAVAGLFVYLGSRIEISVTKQTFVEGTLRTVTSRTLLHGAGFEQIALTRQLVLAASMPALAVLVTFLWIIILMNAYNFMDGTDGLAGAFVVTVALGLLAAYVPEAGQNMLGLKAHVCVIMVLATMLVGVSLGFLFYNWPPAKTFLGDCGSQYVGFLLAVFLAQLTRVAGEPVATGLDTELELTLPRRAYVDFLAVVILVWPFLYDVTYTMARRAVRLKPIWRAHHEHLYQRLNDLGWSHRQILLFSLPFYLAHAGLFYAYCWAPNETVRLRWAAAALVPMLLYTVIVVILEKTSSPPVAAVRKAPSGEAADEEQAPADQP